MIKNSTRIVFFSFLKKVPKEEFAGFYKYISSSEKLLLEKLPQFYGDPTSCSKKSGCILNKIDPSWIAPFLRNLSEKEISLFLSVLPSVQRKAVEKNLLYSSGITPLTLLGKSFLEKTLLNYLTAEVEDLFPEESLPDSPLNILLEIENETMAMVVDFLGLYDLSLEMRQIIGKQKLHSIYHALSPLQFRYLQTISQQQELVVFTRMKLASWQGNKEKLQLLIRQRGANRLSKALYGQDPSFLWYILHKLDVEKALLIKKLFPLSDNEKVASLLIKQVVNFVNFIRENHE
jgi:hypothetical protein